MQSSDVAKSVVKNVIKSVIKIIASQQMSSTDVLVHSSGGVVKSVGNIIINYISKNIVKSVSEVVVNYVVKNVIIQYHPMYSCSFGD